MLDPGALPIDFFTIRSETFKVEGLKPGSYLDHYDLIKVDEEG